MSTWTKEPPKEDGFYWWRYADEPTRQPEVGEWDQEMRCLKPTGSDIFFWEEDGPSTLADYEVEFWSERLIPPAP